jgi:hypothetical protein
MLNLSFDFKAHVMIASMSGGQTAAEHARVYAAIENLDRLGREQDHSIALLFLVARDNPAPDAHWRRRFAEQRKTLGSPHVFLSIVTQSAIMQGVLTAMNWIVPQPPRVTCVTHATFEDSASWIERNQGTSRLVLRGLLYEMESSIRSPVDKPTA